MWISPDVILQITVQPHQRQVDSKSVDHNGWQPIERNAHPTPTPGTVVMGEVPPGWQNRGRDAWHGRVILRNVPAFDLCPGV